MLQSFPASLTPAGPLRPAAPPAASVVRTVANPGSWRYPNDRSRKLGILAAILSASMHAVVFFGFGKPKPKPAPAQAAPVIELAITMPQLKELEEPDPIVNDDPDQKPDLGVPVPMQADLPQIAKPTDFVQKLDFNSLIEKPDMSDAKIINIPDNIRRGVKVADNFGPIFNLADLDRHPQPIFQPAPSVPTQLRREGRSAIVRVEFIVDTEGRVLNPFVIESDDPGFNDAAVAGVGRWKFKAGMRGGRKVNVRMHVPIFFKITDVME